MSSQVINTAAGEQQGPPTSFAYAYCHGFLSGPNSFKGQALRKSMLEVGVDMSLLNLNGEDNNPGAITIAGALKAVRDFHVDKKSAAGDPGLKLRLAGSSLGGYITSRYAELYPDEVDRIFMLCPSFCLGRRAPTFVSEEEMVEWERSGARVFPLSTGGEASVSWAFVEEAKLQTDYPAYRCPAEIVHGLNDDVVPAESTRMLVEGSTDLAKRTSAMFVTDDHALTKLPTMTLITKAMVDFFELGALEGDRATAVGVDGEGGSNKSYPVHKNIEVEAKFLADDVNKIKESVLARGGKFVGEQVFTDMYWDAQGCGLTVKDWWLRNRAGRWELKVPAGDGGRGMTAYREVTLASEIVRELEIAGFLGASESRGGSGTSLDESVLEAAGFEAFASFRTNRAKYRLEGYAIDIDRASFGHEVVEIEVMSSPAEAEIALAGEGIAALARSLGVQSEEASGRPVKGKLLEYILRNCPKQLEVLTRRRALQANNPAA